MKLISYAQNFEDVMLWRALKHIENGFYIDVGAAWPDEHSVTKLFYLAGWTGINVEPNPQFHVKLNSVRTKDINLPVAVSDKAGQVSMNFIKDTGLSTASSEIAAMHVAAGWQVSPQLVELKTLAEICKDHLPKKQEINFLKIDVEGFEESVIRGNDWSQYRPWIVVVEATLPMSQVESFASWESILFAAKYTFVYADGLNRFYVSEEHLELASAFKYPPNVFDEFSLCTAVIAEEEAQQARVRAQQAEEEAQQARVRAQQAEEEAQQARVRAQQAEEEAQQARVRAQQAEEKAQLAVELSANYQREIQKVLNSLSWRITKPLRDLNPKYKLISLLRKNKKLVKKLSWLDSVAPNFWRRLEAIALESHSPSTDYITLSFDDFSLNFAKGPLSDSRGIGRVSRELLKHLTASASPKEADAEKKEIHFFTSIHWCPDVLPSNSVVLIHDVIPLLFPEEFPEGIVKEWRGRFKSIAQSASKIVTISQASAESIVKLLNVPPENVSVVHNGVSKLPVADNLDLPLPVAKFFVFLGANDWHKNLEVVFQALLHDEAADLHLVMIGKNHQCLARVTQLGLQKRVHFLGALSDAEVGYVLTRSAGLVFPSLYEGFGLPPLEAALIGVPSICSSRPAMTELIPTGNVFCAPDNPGDWARAMVKTAKATAGKADVTELSVFIEKNYTWDRTVAKLLQVFAGP
ncbi:FkbM family methyltransferase [Rhodoferax sp. TBRC 17198]|uniref:FkbM family methyltransferase n=1 Tax=Rhodoferax potami TaxID=3068338 RepID=UPI0028BDB097|nr:FkbM family methyltransferase [Rhodoferax sp. TBRC 17198]MDT7521967.1 FkbM family methyltransferase [Rhodoferax sp. TBRC 17198]